MSGEPGGSTEPAGEEPPPFLGRWRNLYALVIAAHVALIALFSWLTRKFS